MLFNLTIVLLSSGLQNAIEKTTIDLTLFIIRLEHVMPITPHANGEPLLKRSSSYSHFPLVCNDSACWSANNNGSALTYLLNDDTYLLNDDTYRFICADNCVIHPDKYSKVRII